jgi:hypothetical protein
MRIQDRQFPTQVGERVGAGQRISLTDKGYRAREKHEMYHGAVWEPDG